MSKSSKRSATREQAWGFQRALSMWHAGKIYASDDRRRPLLMAGEGRHRMPQRFIMIVLKNILVPIDFEQESLQALSYGRELARQFHASVHMLHVVGDLFSLRGGTEGTLTAFPRLLGTFEQIAGKQLEMLIPIDDRKPGAKTVVVTSAVPAHAIVAYARDAQVDLIVMGTHGRGGTSGALMGSVAERVVRTAPCPVLTVRCPEHEFVIPDAPVAHSEV
jgi:nucleotide-binding universal stress UspA family protein